VGRSLPAAVSALRRRDADHRLDHRPFDCPRHPRPPRRTDRATPHRTRPRPAAMGGCQRRARADPLSGAPAQPGLRVRPAHRVVATNVAVRLRAPAGLLAPAPASPTARGHPGIGARAQSDDKRAQQPIAAENPRLTRTTVPTVRLARSNCLSVDDLRISSPSLHRPRAILVAAWPCPKGTLDSTS